MRRLVQYLSLVSLLGASVLARQAIGSSLTFDLPYGQRKCFTEDLPYGANVRGAVHVASGRGDMSLDLFVSDSHGKVYFHRADVNSVKFSFAVAQHGGGSGGHHAHGDYGHGHDYGQGDIHGGSEHYVDPHSRDTEQQFRFCVVNQIHPHAAPDANVKRRVTLEVSVETERHTAALRGLARAADADKISVTFSHVAAEVDTIVEKLDELRVREQVLSELNESTATSILRISLLACTFTVVTGLLNFFSLKSFFKQKKLA